MNKLPIGWILAIPFALGAVLALAGEKCHHCGCHCDCQKICQLKCETKKVPVVTYKRECEDFCVSGPQTKCTCGGTGCDRCCTSHDGPPAWASMFTKKKLIRVTTEKEEKVYKWVVVDLCAACAGEVESTTKPEAKKPDAK